MHNRWLTSTLFVLKRVASLLVSLFLASIIIFLVLRLLPGDSSASLGVGATQDQLELAQGVGHQSAAVDSVLELAARSS